MYYKLDENKKIIPCSMQESRDRIDCMINDGTRHLCDEIVDGKRISTVWLGIDYQYGDGKPLLFETMVFKSPPRGENIYCERYSTWDEAVQGHKNAIQWVIDGCKDQEYLDDK